MYNLNFKKLIIRFLPFLYRDEKTIAWLEALTNPVKAIYNDFLVFRNQLLDRVNFSSSVISLEAKLNDTFDPTNRMIYIENVQREEVLFLFDRLLPQEFVLYNRNASDLNPIMYSRAVLAAQNQLNYDFIVHVHQSVTFDEEALKALVNFYKFAEKQYIINIYL